MSTAPAEQWLKAFYPCSAQEAAARGVDEAVRHSLRKWRGLRQENLAKYACALPPIKVNEETCALCVLFIGNEDCQGCPIADATFCCNNVVGAFSRYDLRRDPEPMIQILTEAASKTGSELV